MTETQAVGEKLQAHERIKRATRCVLFETDLEDLDYATSGGTAFVISAFGRPFGVTAMHVQKGFPWGKLVITNSKFGSQIAGIDGIYHGKDPAKDSVDSDILDLAIISFSPDTPLEFFKSDFYEIDEFDLDADEGDILIAHGAPKIDLQIDYEKQTITPIFHTIGLVAGSTSDSDSAVRISRGRTTLSDAAGLSGSAVWNLTKNCLAGMVVRGGISQGEITVRFVEISDIRQMLLAIHEGRPSLSYRKPTRA